MHKSAIPILITYSILLFNSAIANGIAFRYLPGRPEVSSPVVLENVEVGPFLESHELPARSPGGWGMAAPMTAEFDGVTSILYSTDTTAVRQILGPQFSVEVWFQPFALSDTVALVSNRLSSVDEGFSLFLENGLVVFEFTLGSKNYRLPTESMLAVNEKHWLAAIVSYNGFKLALQLYHNGSMVATISVDTLLAGRYDLRGRYFVGTIANGDPVTVEPKPAFNGHLFGATVRAYIANGTYLKAPIPFDGGAYFGIPAYHEYPVESTQLPVDLRISASQIPLAKTVYVPYTNDFYILQGIAGRQEINADDSTQLVYMSAYHRLRNGTTETQESIIVELDIGRTTQVRRCFRLLGVLQTAHVGGIAHSHDAIFVASRGILERYPLPPYQGIEGGKYFDLQPDTQGSLDVIGDASFVSVEGDTLWVGDFRWPEEQAAFLYGYAIAEDGRPIRGVTPQIYALPKRVQGVDFFTYGDKRFCFLSLSGGSNISEILRIRADRLSPISIAEADTIFILPRGGEDLAFFPDGTLWSGSESGSDYYQKRPNPWSQFFPFLYAISPQVLFGDITPITGIERGDNSSLDIGADRLSIECFPNPTNSELKIIFSVPERMNVTVRVFDVLGRQIVTLLENALVERERSVLWRSSVRPSGQYFIVLETPVGMVKSSVVLVK